MRHAAAPLLPPLTTVPSKAWRLRYCVIRVPLCSSVAMPSDKQIQASSIERSPLKIPVTPQGKANSSRNSYRHGLLAGTVVLAEESHRAFPRTPLAGSHERIPAHHRLPDFSRRFWPSPVGVSCESGEPRKPPWTATWPCRIQLSAPRPLESSLALSGSSENSCPPEASPSVMRSPSTASSPEPSSVFSIFNLVPPRASQSPTIPSFPPGHTWKDPQKTETQRPKPRRRTHGKNAAAKRTRQIAHNTSRHSGRIRGLRSI